MSDDKSKWAVFAIVYIGSLAVLVSWNGLFVPMPPGTCAGNMCRIYLVFSEFQTLFGAGLAIMAAWYAAVPVWRQLRKMDAQHDVMARDIIARRLLLIEKNTDYVGSELGRYLGKIIRQVYDLTEDQSGYMPDGLSSEWAHNMGLGASSIRRDLAKFQDSKAETLTIENARSDLMSSLSSIIDCFETISAPDSVTLDLLAESEIDEIRAASAQARVDLEARIRDVEEARDKFFEVANSEIAKFKTRLRDIDDNVLNSG